MSAGNSPGTSPIAIRVGTVRGPAASTTACWRRVGGSPGSPRCCLCRCCAGAAAPHATTRSRSPGRTRSPSPNRFRTSPGSPTRVARRRRSVAPPPRPPRSRSRARAEGSRPNLGGARAHGARRVTRGVERSGPSGCAGADAAGREGARAGGRAVDCAGGRHAAAAQARSRARPHPAHRGRSATSTPAPSTTGPALANGSTQTGIGPDSPAVTPSAPAAGGAAGAGTNGANISVPTVAPAPTSTPPSPRPPSPSSALPTEGAPQVPTHAARRRAGHAGPGLFGRAVDGRQRVLDRRQSRQPGDAIAAFTAGRRPAVRRLSCGLLNSIGAWRSLVARTVRVGEVPGSNPGAPTKKAPQMRGFFFVEGRASMGRDWAVTLECAGVAKLNSACEQGF